MSQVTNIDKQQKIQEQASIWVVKLDDGLSQSETSDLKKWLNRSAYHKTSFLQLVELWDKMDALSQLSEVFEHKPSGLFAQRNNYLAIAASVCLVCVLSIGLWFGQGEFGTDSQPQNIIFQAEYSTKVGEQSTFYLQDNTKVKLNTNSLLTVTYTDTQRLFELSSGELHVTVAHNKDKPLSVYAGQRIIQAVGTAFNVELNQRLVEIIVTDGKVLVSGHNEYDSAQLGSSQINLASDSLSLLKGQSAIIAEDVDKPISLVTDTSVISSKLAWQEGELIFSGETLSDAINEVSRYTSLRFQFNSTQIKDIQIAGLFKTNDIQGLLTALKYNFDIESTTTDDGIVILSKKPS